MASNSSNPKLLILNLPDPSFQIVEREYAGGFGVSRHTRLGRRSPLERPILNLFLPYLAAVAEEAGCEYSALDAQALGLSFSEILQEAKKFDPDIIVSMISLPSLHADKKLLSRIKSELPNAITVACGTVCSVMPKEVLLGSNIDLASIEHFPYVNGLRCLLKGFSELTRTRDFAILSEFSYLQDSEVRKNPQKGESADFTKYHPKYEVLPLQKYQHFIDSEGNTHLFVPILGSRGCPYNCFYCPYPLGFGNETIFQNPKIVVDEMEHLYSVAHIEGFLFRNQSFTLNLKWAENICNEILKRGLDISWLCEARADQTSINLLSTMARSGCKRIHYGVETGDPTLIMKAKSGVSLQTLSKAFSVARKFEIWRQAHIILGLPTENRQSLENTLQFLLKVDPDSVAINFATPYPGTKLFHEAREKGLINTDDWSRFSSFDIVLDSRDLTDDDLRGMARRISRGTLIQRIGELFSRTLTKHASASCRLLAKYYVPKLAKESLRL
jgi:anaerobic magnesium-protoporphyrin IX monomethyl ester cyclase